MTEAFPRLHQFPRVPGLKSTTSQAPELVPARPKQSRRGVRDLGDVCCLWLGGGLPLLSPFSGPFFSKKFSLSSSAGEGDSPISRFLETGKLGTKTEVTAAEVAGSGCRAQPGSMPGTEVPQPNMGKVEIHEQITSQGVHEFPLASPGGVIKTKAGQASWDFRAGRC